MLEQLPRPVMQHRTPDQPTQPTPSLDRPTHKRRLQNDRRATLERIPHQCDTHQHSRTGSLCNSVTEQSPLLGQEHSRVTTLQSKPRGLFVPSRDQLASETLGELSGTGFVYFNWHSCFLNICKCHFFAFDLILSADSSQTSDVKLLVAKTTKVSVKSCSQTFLKTFVHTSFCISVLSIIFSFCGLSFLRGGFCYTSHSTTHFVQLRATPRRTLWHAIS